MNMFKPVKATTTEEYVAALPEDRQLIFHKIDSLIRKEAPSLEPYFAQNMPGYGAMDYVNYKKETIKWPIISFASQKNYVSLYVCAVKDGKYIAENYAEKLGNVSVGKSCIRFKKLDDINLNVLSEVIKLAVIHPGFEELKR